MPGEPSHEKAVRRFAVPVTISTTAFPLDHPGWDTISWRMAVRSDVRWPGPLSPTSSHPGGIQGTEASVRGRSEISRLFCWNAGGFGDSCPWIVRVSAPLSTSSAVNWT